MATLLGRVTVVTSNTTTGPFSCTVSNQSGLTLRKSLFFRLFVCFLFVCLFSVAELKHILTYLTYFPWFYRRCTYNVTFRRVRVTIFALEKPCVLHILSVSLYSCLSYPTRNAHAPYCIVICGLSVWLYHVFPNYLTSDAIWGWGGFIEHKMPVLIFSTKMK
jgi:hypothetical protein